MTLVTSWQDQARALIRSAVLAPSSHNTQPWLFCIRAERVDLFADRTRRLPVNDPDDRELAISCGCALMNLRVAAAAQGVPVHVRLCPDPTDRDLLASLSLGTAPVAPGLERLFACLADRHTYRKTFDTRAVPGDLVDRITSAAADEGARLWTLDAAADRARAAALVAEADAIQWANPAWRRELAAWIHARRRGDGLTVPAAAVPLAQRVVRGFDMGRRMAAKDHDLAQRSPVLALLATGHDRVRDWLMAGQAVQRILLEACHLGLQTSFLNGPLQVPALRAQCGQLADGAFPQILLRIGFPSDEATAAPRRPIEDVIIQECTV